MDLPEDDILSGLNVATQAIGGVASGTASGVGSGIGTALGAAFGGPLGATLGGGLGGLIGRMIKTPEQKKQEALADNRTAKMDMIIQSRKDQAMQNDLISGNSIFQTF